MTGNENLRLIREIEANREFLLTAYRLNPALLARAEPRIRMLFEPPPEIDPTWLVRAPDPETPSA